MSYQQSIRDAVAVFQSLGELDAALAAASSLCIEALQNGNKIMACGNGGSAAEAQHLVGELIGRYKHNRPAFASVALSADGAAITCIGNDYCFDEVFERQIRGLGRAGDVLVVFTTSGNSPNVLRALATAHELGIASVAFLGRDGGKARELADCALIVRHPETARAQEAHQFLLHCLMDQIEAGMQ